MDAPKVRPGRVVAFAEGVLRCLLQDVCEACRAGAGPAAGGEELGPALDSQDAAHGALERLAGVLRREAEEEVRGLPGDELKELHVEHQQPLGDPRALQGGLQARQVRPLSQDVHLRCRVLRVVPACPEDVAVEGLLEDGLRQALPRALRRPASREQRQELADGGHDALRAVAGLLEGADARLHLLLQAVGLDDGPQQPPEQKVAVERPVAGLEALVAEQHDHRVHELRHDLQGHVRVEP
mmetsp:Transcript_23725/g.67492  ORF Transcript_23725/g.67492 Transcript_23725/m.67492 type:complete len:240 (-) Transcript_23725:866-1585(-)